MTSSNLHHVTQQSRQDNYMSIWLVIMMSAARRKEQKIAFTVFSGTLRSLSPSRVANLDLDLKEPVFYYHILDPDLKVRPSENCGKKTSKIP